MDTNILRGKSVLTNVADVFSGTLSVGDTAYVNGGLYLCKFPITNTTATPTLNINGIGAKTIYKSNGAPVLPGDMGVDGWYVLQYESSSDKMLLLVGKSATVSSVVTFANDAARAAATPYYDGQLGAQLDTNTLYQAYGTSAGNWALPSNTQIQSDTYAVATGTNTYAITLTPALAAYAAGNSFRVLFTNANNTSSTLNVNGLGAKSIVKNGNQALEVYDIIAGKIYQVTYDGTNFQLVLDERMIRNIQHSSDKYGGGAGGVNTYTANLSPVITSYSTGNVFSVKIGGTNTGASTLNINSLGARAIYANGTSLVGGELLAGTVYTFIYDGTQFHVIGAQGSTLNAWVDVAYNAADFTASTGNWTVSSPDIYHNRYKIIGKTLIWSFNFIQTSVDSVTGELYVKLPLSFNIKNGMESHFAVRLSEGATESFILCRAAYGYPTTLIFKKLNATNFAISVNTTNISGVVTFEID